jgi:hypothetical protein
MEYLVFYGLFLFWFVAMVASVPEAPTSYKAEVCELKEIIFGAKKMSKPELRKAA